MMTAAEYRTIRAGLSLSAHQLATLAGVQLRTVQRWESGQDRPRTDDVADLLNRLDRAVMSEVNRALQAHIDLAPSKVLVLVRYADAADMPRHLQALAPGQPAIALALQGAMVQRAREALALADQPCRIEWRSDVEPRAARHWILTATEEAV